ncbi:MAG: riboflavin kinase, partial [Candidatus Deferrimicrobiaceae bacterium]
VGGILHRSVASVGFNPTFGENSLGLEVHVMDFHRDIYGENIAVYFRDRIRDERKFKSVQELVRQIEKDVQYAREAKLPVRRVEACAGQDPAATRGGVA